MRSERIFRTILAVSAAGIVCLLLAILFTLAENSLPSFKAFGFRMLLGKTWDPVTEEFGALPFIVGTLLTSFLALIVSSPFSLSLAILSGDLLKEGPVSYVFNTFSEVLAGIPSVIYGFWGLFSIAPFIRGMEIRFHATPYGVGILASSLILAIMIIPYSASISREVIRLVPSDIKEAACSLGATRFEVLKKIILPYAMSGIAAGILLSLGRALGETMAVTMVIGNSNFIPKSIFSPGNTMASVIANEFSEATGRLHLSSLIEMGFWLFVITAFINLIGNGVIKKLKVSA